MSSSRCSSTFCPFSPPQPDDGGEPNVRIALPDPALYPLGVSVYPSEPRVRVGQGLVPLGTPAYVANLNLGIPALDYHAGAPGKVQVAELDFSSRRRGGRRVEVELVQVGDPQSRRRERATGNVSVL